MPRARALLFFLTSAVILAPPILSGCGRSEAAQTRAQAQPAVDQRFASAEAILDYYNRLSMTGPQVDAHEIMDMIYAENPHQERLLRAVRKSLPLSRIDQACWTHFGVGFHPESERPPFEPERQAAVLIESDGARAKAEHELNDGAVDEIHLVKIGERWWVSGFTLEYHPEFQDARGTDFDRMEEALEYYLAVAPRVITDIESGRWDGAGSEGVNLARLAMIGYIAEQFPEVQRNPGLLKW